MSLEPIWWYPGGGYILWKRQLEDKQGQGKGDKISVQQRQHQVILQSPPASLMALQHPGTHVLPVLPWALGKLDTRKVNYSAILQDI